MQILKLYCCTEGAHFYGIFFALFAKKMTKSKIQCRAGMTLRHEYAQVYISNARAFWKCCQRARGPGCACFRTLPPPFWRIVSSVSLVKPKQFWVKSCHKNCSVLLWPNHNVVDTSSKNDDDEGLDVLSKTFFVLFWTLFCFDNR